MKLDGKVAVVTGAARGLGFAVGQALAARGARVVLAGRTAADVEAAAGGLGPQALGVGCDVRSAMQVDALLARAVAAHGGVDIWVNAAGPSGVWGPARDIAAADQREAIETVVLGTHLGTVAALRHMAPRGAGQIVNLLGRDEDEPGPANAAWDASKAWVRSFTLAVAREQEGTKVKLIAFLPGLMESRMALMPEVAPGAEAEHRARLPALRLKAVPAQVPAERLAQALERGEQGLVRGLPGLWAVRGPMRMVFGGRPDFVISPKVKKP